MAHTDEQIERIERRQAETFMANEILIAAVRGTATDAAHADALRQRAVESPAVLPRVLELACRETVRVAANAEDAPQLPRRAVLGLTDRRLLVWEHSRFSNDPTKLVHDFDLDVVVDASIAAGDLRDGGVLSIYFREGTAAYIAVPIAQIPEACALVTKLRRLVDGRPLDEMLSAV
jgi:hypothetical protein